MWAITVSTSILENLRLRGSQYEYFDGQNRLSTFPRDEGQRINSCTYHRIDATTELA